MLKSVGDDRYLFAMPAFHSSIYLLAELTVQLVGGWLAAVVVGGSTLWVFFLLLVRGFWDKTGKPAIKELLVSMQGDPENVKRRQDEIQGVIQAWHNAPDQISTRTEFVKSVIDNEVHRDDGVIHKDITTKVTELEVELGKMIDGVAKKFDKFEETQERRDQENREFSSKVLAKLARIEGAFATMSSRKFGSTSESFTNLPAQRPPKPGGSSSED